MPILFDVFRDTLHGSALPYGPTGCTAIASWGFALLPTTLPQTARRKMGHMHVWLFSLSRRKTLFAKTQSFVSSAE